jgi:hypothetical protein
MVAITPKVSVANFQYWMQTVIMHPGTEAEALTDATAQSYLPAVQAEKFILPSHSLTITERLAIYRQMYVWRLVEVLAMDFTTVAQFVGETQFEALIKAYLQVHPSQSYNLNLLSYAFPAFLKTVPGLKKREFLSDLARLELAVSKAVEAAEVTPLGPADIIAVPSDAWYDVRLKFIPAFDLLAFRYPVNAYLQAAINSEPLPDTRRADSWVAVYRKDYTVWRLPLHNAAYQLLRRLQEGKSLGAAIDYVVSHSARNTWQTELFDWFREWFAEGFFCEITY